MSNQVWAGGTLQCGAMGDSPLDLSSIQPHPHPIALHPIPIPIPIPATYPVAAAITQPPCSGVASTQQPWLSWLMPKLWPISWAMVAAAPMGSSEWSCQGVGGCVSSGEQRGVAPTSVWGGSCVPSEEGLWERGDFVP